MITDTEVTNLIKYYNSFATAKQKKDINTLLNKPEHLDEDIKRLKQYLFKYKCYIEANTMTVESRLYKIKNSPYNLNNQYKDRVKKQYFKSNKYK